MVADINISGQGSEPAFSFRSGHPALDFAATRMFREPVGHARELLTEPQALAAWAVAAGLLDRAPPQLPARSLVAAIELREAVYEPALATIGSGPSSSQDLATLNHHAAQKPVAVTLAADGSVVRSGSLHQVLGSLARGAVELFGGPEATRVHQCARAGCTRLFIDRTRGHSRVWCGMSACGNRVNAAAYRRRRTRAS